MDLPFPMVFNQFKHVVDTDPTRLMLVGQGQKVSYAEAYQQILQLSQSLEDAGVQPGDIVLLYGRRSIEYVVAILANIKIGAAYLPIDTQLPKERQEWMAKDSCAAFSLVCQEGQIIKNLVSNPKKVPIETLYVMYTTGSSGVPKGVLGTQAGLLNRVHWMQSTFPIQTSEIHLMKTAISFVDHIAEIFQAVLSGVTLVVLQEGPFDPVVFLEILKTHAINRIVVVPSLLQSLLPFLPSCSLSQLKYIFCSGEVLPVELAKQCARLLPHVRLINIYGSTEVSADVTYYEVPYAIEEKILNLFTTSETRTERGSFSKPNVSFQKLLSQFSHSPSLDIDSTPRDYLNYLEQEIAPFSIDVSHPRFIGHMTSGLAKCMGEISQQLTQWNQNTVKIETSKACTLLEREALRHLHQLFYAHSSDFYLAHESSPHACLGVIVSGGTLANIQALYLARFHALIHAGGSLENIRLLGCFPTLQSLGYQGMVILGSSLMHYSIEKALFLLGLGLENIQYVPCDILGKIDVQALNALIKKCRREKQLILALIGIAGSTETGSIDPLEEMAAIAAQEEIFFHVDAAWGGGLIFSPHHKHHLRGISQADSITFCGHKQMYLPLGVSVLLFKDPLLASLGRVHARYQSKAGSYDQGQFSLMGSKPANAVYIHAGLRIYGVRGYQYLIERGCMMAKLLACKISQHDSFELIGTPQMNIVNYRYIPEMVRHKTTPERDTMCTQATYAIQQAQFLSGQAAVSYTTLIRNTTEIGTFRSVLANPLTTEEDLNYVLQDQLTIASRLFGENNHPIETHQHLMASSTSVPIGYPISGAEIAIVDELDREVAEGEIGEIVVSGVVVSGGYLHEEENMTPKFIPDKDHHKYRTGDFGKRLFSGAIEYVGRQDQQVKIRGARVHLIELEQQAYASNWITQCCALVYKEELFLIYSLKDSLFKTTQEIKTYLSHSLPKHMIPSMLIDLPVLPLLPSGKIDRQQLYRLVEHRRGQHVILPIDQSPSSPIERLRLLCSTLLNTDQVDEEVNFFDLGFNSLSLGQLMLELHQQGYPFLKMIDFYSYPSIATLGEFITEYQLSSLTQPTK